MNAETCRTFTRSGPLLFGQDEQSAIVQIVGDDDPFLLPGCISHRSPDYTTQ
jgi:hypothetical protein